jgi:hypothetical protein
MIIISAAKEVNSKEKGHSVARFDAASMNVGGCRQAAVLAEKI